ncbi:MAG: 50S ribosomal protein L4 [Candidatus Niyogibacteria bacterium]|nr:50S ribosomal protein L4 [Candidatus Niyogibacteria bacterium]
MKSVIYNQNGKKSGEIELADKVFGVKWNSDLVHQVVTALRANSRSVIAHAKGRGEVSGGGKKPWKQKGTGRARHGSIRSPIWVGGGVSHGPNKEKNYEQKIGRSMKQKAFATILSRKLHDGEVLFLEDLKVDAPKTKEAVKILGGLRKIESFEKLGLKGGKALVVFAAKEDTAIRALRNLPFVGVLGAKQMNVLDVASSKFLILPQSAVEAISAVLTK